MSDRTPEIRVEGFTDDWEQRELGEEFLFFSGLTYSPSNVRKDGSLVLRSSNVQNGEIVDADNVYVENSVVNSKNVEVGDIAVVVRNGSRSLIGKHAQIKKEMPNTVIGAFMTGITYKVPKFATALLGTQTFKKEIAKNLGATINQITTGIFKQAMLQRMFPKEGEKEPEVRFKGFEGEWRISTLNEVIQLEFKGRAQADKLSPGNNEYLDADRLNGGKPIKVDEARNVSKEDILILWDGSKAGTVYYGYEGVLGSTLKAFVINRMYSPAFIYQYLKGNAHDIFANYRTPNIPHVIRNFTSVFNVPIPSLEEQVKVGVYFETLDKNISAKQFELKKLKQIKQALLEKMFV